MNDPGVVTTAPNLSSLLDGADADLERLGERARARCWDFRSATCSDSPSRAGTSGTSTGATTRALST